MSGRKKRTQASQGSKGNPAASSEADGPAQDYEDPFGDVYDEEDVEALMAQEEEQKQQDGHGGEDNEDIHEEDDGRMQGESDDEDEGGEGVKRVFRPGVDTLPEGEELIYDPSAYVMYHSFRTEWPCLTFDLFRDDLGDNRQRFPHSMFMMTGSQADKQDANKLTLLKLSDLGKTPKQETEDADDDDNSDTDDEVDYEPVLEHVDVPHMGGINRLRCMPTTAGGTIAPGIVATMGDNGKANIFDLRAVLKGLMSGQPYPKSAVPTKAAYTMHAHTTEGYAIDWSPTVLGRLASGDCAADICVWMDGLNHKPATQMFKGHTDSVEDLQWSPSETTVFCSASADNTVKVWDIRGTAGPQISIDAHTDDVNVIAWNPSVNYLLASGCDDGSFKVWDLRAIRDGKPIANFAYHKAPITSLDWAPHDESLLCVSGADDQVTVWDLSVEADDEEEKVRTHEVVASDEDGLGAFPPQLLFIHQGQTNVKEVHFHPQIPGAIVTTAEDGFNIFKPAINAM